MFRKLASIALASLAISAPASAELFHTGNGTYMAISQDGASLSIEIDHVDNEGDRLMSLGFIDEASGAYKEGGAWVSCEDNMIAHEGEGWQAVDHRTLNGYVWDVACES